jgi:hypothetical protein
MELKSTVYEIVRNYGPVLPVHVSQKINSNLFLASALLSELVSDKKLKISYAKIGGSPVYYLPGQENKLNVLYNSLPQREKEAYNLLKEKLVLNANEIEPVVRVALSNLRDFAIPVALDNTFYWKWYLADDSVLNKKPEILVEEKSIQPVNEVILEKPISIEPEIEKVKKLKVVTNGVFLEHINKYMTLNKVYIGNDIEIKKKEVVKVVTFNSVLGDLTYLMYAKDKQKISEADLSLAYQLGQKHKLPVLFLSPGELSKKSQKYLNENLRGLVIFKQINE